MIYFAQQVSGTLFQMEWMNEWMMNEIKNKVLSLLEHMDLSYEYY